MLAQQAIFLNGRPDKMTTNLCVEVASNNKYVYKAGVSF